MSKRSRREKDRPVNRRGFRNALIAFTVLGSLVGAYALSRPSTKNEVREGNLAQAPVLEYAVAKKFPDLRQVYLSNLLGRKDSIGTASWQYISDVVYDPDGTLIKAEYRRWGKNGTIDFGLAGREGFISACTPVFTDALIPKSPVYVRDAAFLTYENETEISSCLDHEGKHAEERAKGIPLPTSPTFGEGEVHEDLKTAADEAHAYHYQFSQIETGVRSIPESRRAFIRGDAVHVRETLEHFAAGKGRDAEVADLFLKSMQKKPTFRYFR